MSSWRLVKASLRTTHLRTYITPTPPIWKFWKICSTQIFYTCIICMNSYDSFQHFYDCCSIISVLKKRYHYIATPQTEIVVFSFFFQFMLYSLIYTYALYVYHACSVYNTIIVNKPTMPINFGKLLLTNYCNAIVSTVCNLIFQNSKYKLFN